MDSSNSGSPRRPFLQQPGDDGYFLANPALAAAMLRLRHSVTAPGGVAVLSGGPGVGKTAFVETSLSPVAAQIQHLRIDMRSGEPDELYEGLLASLLENPGDESGKLPAAATLRRLREALTAQRASGRQLVLSLDVAGLNVELARRLLRLVHVAGEQRTRVSIILQGPHTLHQLLDVPGLLQLRQRVSFRLKARPLSLLETAGYIRHCFTEVGQDAETLLAVNAPASVYLYVAGVPRLINTLMDATLGEAQARQLSRIDADLVRQVAEQLGWKPLASRPAADAAAEKAGSPARSPERKAAKKADVAAAQPAPVDPVPARPALAASDITRRLLIARAAETMTDGDLVPAESRSGTSPASAENPRAPRESRPPLAVPMDATDTGATGMLRLEDLDAHFAETAFTDDSGHLRTLVDVEKVARPA